jgi:hypothetical protein
MGFPVRCAWQAVTALIIKRRVGGCPRHGEEREGEKMAFVSFDSIPGACGPRGGKKTYELMISVRKPPKNSQKQIVTFAIRNAIVAKARFKLGDRMDILFDAESLMAKIARTTEGKGWKLNPAGGSKGASTCSFSISLRPGMPDMVVGREYVDVELDEDGILFDFPKALLAH